jgi:hypothetical protein
MIFSARMFNPIPQSALALGVMDSQSAIHNPKSKIQRTPVTA